MSDLINEQVKEEFKRFFEYAFRYNPKYWQELPGWEVLGKEAARMQKDTAALNRLISSVVTSEQHLKRIISDSSLDPAKELRYLAYLFLKDMNKADGLPEIKLPEIPAQFARMYDNPNRLLEMVMDSSRSSELRQQALKRVKEIVLWSSLPKEVFIYKNIPVFNNGIFTQEKFDQWKNASRPLAGSIEEMLDIVKGYPDYIEHSLVFCSQQGDPYTYFNLLPSRRFISDAFIHLSRGDENYARHQLFLFIEAQTRVLRKKFITTRAYAFNINFHDAYYVCPLDGFDANRPSYLYWRGEFEKRGAVLNPRKYADPYIDRRQPGYVSGNLSTEPSTINFFRSKFHRLDFLDQIANEVWNKYRKEQDEEFPARLDGYEASLAKDITSLAQYEKSLESAKFPEHAIAEIEDISGDKRYIILKDKLGEDKANEFWGSREKLLDAISGKFSIELKNIFASRLCDISIITVDDQNKIIGGLGESYEYMFWGDSMNIQVIDPSITRVNKNELFAETPNQDKANHAENEDL